MSNKNDRWSALSMKERADLMNMYITNGISDLKEMKKHYNSFSGEEDTESSNTDKKKTELIIPESTIVNTDNYRQQIEKYNQLRQAATDAYNSYDWNKLNALRDSADSLGKEIAKYTLNEYSQYPSSPLNYGKWAGTSAAGEPQDIRYLLESNIREDGKEVTDWLKSYVNSEGFQRIRENQKNWWDNRHPYRKHLYFLTGDRRNINNYVNNVNQQIGKTHNFVLDGYPSMSFANPYLGRTFTYKMTLGDDKKYPFHETQMHEVDHLFNIPAVYYDTINAEVLDQNTNTKKNHHDEYNDEKHSDNIGIKYLLFKEGIYDARSDKDVTPEQIQQLREKYPKLRFLQQLNNEDAAFQINNVAQNITNENKLDYVNPKNIAADGGNIFSGEESFASKVHKYPEVTIKEEPWADAYFKQHPEIAGMAIGAGLNGVGGPRRVIINPYSKNINKDAVLLNERSRHYMEESNFKLPKVTDEQMKKYEGTPYQNDTLNVGRTEAARFISGDKHLLTPEQIEYINSYSRGGRILDGTEVEQTLSGEPLYYDDTYIEPAVVKAFNSQEDYNKYYGEQFGRQVARGMNSAAPYVLEAAMLPFDIAGIAEAPMLIYKGVKHVPKLMKGLKDLPTKVKISNKKLGKLFDFADTKMPIKEGSESVVYIGDDKVFKVPSEGSPEMTLDELAEFNKNYISKRNAPPHTAPLAVEGVVKGSTKGKYYPVYSQQKLNVVGEDTMPFWEWEKHRALLDEKMAKSGWPDIGGAYYNKDLNLHVGDIKPSNVAYDNKGNLLIIDGDVYGNGGKLLTKNKK